MSNMNKSPGDTSQQDEIKVCGRCSKQLPTFTVPRCSTCKNAYHPDVCISMSRTTWTKMEKQKKNAWACPNCGGEDFFMDRSSGPDPVTQYSSNINEISQPRSQVTASFVNTPLAGQSQRANKRFRNSPDDFSQLTNLGLELDMSVFKDENQPAGIKNLNKMVLHLIRDMSGKLEAFATEIKSLKATVDMLVVENKVLKQKQEQSQEVNRAADYRHRILSDYTRVDNLILYGGYKAQNDADTFVMFHAFAAAHGIDLKSDDVAVCHPLPSKGQVNKHICKFLKRGVKNAILAASKQRRLTPRMLKWSQTDAAVLDKPVFVMEHLSPDTARLLYETKKRLAASENGPYTYIWCRQGRILLRNDGDQGRPLEVCWYGDIKKILDHAIQRGFRPKDIPPQGNDQMEVTEVTTNDSGGDSQA